MKSLLQVAIGLGVLSSIALQGCGRTVDGESAAEQQAALGAVDASEAEAAFQAMRPGVESVDGQSANSLHPLVTCVAPGTGNELIAHLGYDNPSATMLSIPVGRHNAFIPPPFDRAQPTTFAPGRNDNAVSVPFHPRRAPLNWQLGHQRAVAGRDRRLAYRPSLGQSLPR